MSGEISFNLGLASIPETRDKELFPEFLRLYNAIKLTAAMLDARTGYTTTNSDEARPFTSSLTLANYTTFDMICQGAIPAARLCTIVAVGGSSRAKLVDFSNNLARCISMGDYENGEVGKFMLTGLIKFDSDALTAGANYRNAGSGYMNLETAMPTYWQKQFIGFALDTQHLWFQPDITFNLYVDPSP